MDKSITHFSLWKILIEDEVYGKELFAEELCREFAAKYRLYVSGTHDGQEITHFGDGAQDIEIKLLFCQDYMDALHEIEEHRQELHGEVGPPIEKVVVPPDMVKGLWQEIFLGLATEYGLPFRNKPKIFNPNKDVFTMDVLKLASPKEFKAQELQEFLQELELPLPAKLFPEHKPNTELLQKNIPEDSVWVTDYSLSNIRKLLKEWEEEADASIKIESREVILSYQGKSVRVLKKNGYVILKHLVENPNVEFSCLDIYNLVPKPGTQYEYPEASEYGYEESMPVSDEKTWYDAKDELSRLKEEFETTADETKRIKIEEQMDQLNAYLKENFNSKGKPRVERTPNEEKCRKNVSNSIRYILTELSIKHPPLYEKLAKTKALKLGYTLQYRIPPGIQF